MAGTHAGGEVKGGGADGRAMSMLEDGGKKAEANRVKERLVRMIASGRRRGKEGERLDEMVALTVLSPLFVPASQKLAPAVKKAAQAVLGLCCGPGRRERCSQARTPELTGCLSRAGSSRTCASGGGGIKRGFARGLQGDGEERKEEGEVRLNGCVSEPLAAVGQRTGWNRPGIRRQGGGALAVSGGSASGRLWNPQQLCEVRAPNH